MRFFKDLVLTAIILAGVLLLLELGLRLAGVKYEASLYTPEAERGYALRPGAQGWSVTENENYVRINAEGMYDKEHTVSRPRDVIRIAVIGSSEAEAQQVSLDNTFEAVMERELSAELAKCGCKVEVLNFAVPGYSFSQEYLTLHNQVWQYQPQIVVLATNAYGMLRNTRKLYPGPTLGTPFYVLDHGRLVPDIETRLATPPDPDRVKSKGRLSDWMNKSRILSMLNEARVNATRIVARLASQSHLLKPLKPSASSDIPPDYIRNWPYDPMRPEMRESWAIGDAFSKWMKQDCDDHSAEFWIVTIGMEEEVNPRMSDRLASEKRIGVNSLLLSDLYIEELARNDGIHVITLAPRMGEFALDNQVALHGFFNTEFNDGHWNETGHRVAGHIIAQDLLSGSVFFKGPLASGMVTSGTGPRSQDARLCICRSE